ncbi:dihydrolipoyl dehydrogenase [Heyndrickxia sporothermodurans]|nr:dihydrolipoyl dehydrogenase [Heyndrickxia sporothermodurans]
MDKYDVIVVGGGPGGYVAAIRAAQLGGRVALVEKNELGGTCLNRGCIPSKTLLKHAEAIELIEKARGWGIETGPVTFSLKKMMARKNKVIETLRSGITSLLKKGKITVYNGEASVNQQKHVSIQLAEELKVIQGEKIIVATGGRPFLPPIPGMNEVDVHTSDTIFNLTEIPKSIVIVGGGVIGVEFASIFASLNTEVTIVEMGNRIIPSEDSDAAKLLQKILKKKKIRILVNKKVVSMSQDGEDKSIVIQSDDGKTKKLLCEEVLIAAGRKPNLSAIEKLDIRMNGLYIEVNEHMETNLEGIYAVGDIIGGWQLAHVASAEGLIAAANAVGMKERIDYKVIPRCVYTSPEIASVGMSEEQVKERRIPYRVEKYSLSSNGKAIAMDETDGFVKIMVEEQYGEILGVVMAGAHVTEMISQSSAFIYLEGTVDELANMIQPHPSISESLFEVAGAWKGMGIHT